MLALLLFAACSPGTPSPSRSAAEADAPGSAPESAPPVEEPGAPGGDALERESAAERAAPPAGPSEPLSLDVPGFGPALVVLAEGAMEPLPLLVAAHGAGDSPEWQCEHWSGVAGGRYVILCPRGTSLGGGGYYFKNHIELEKELVAALAALRKAHGASVREGAGVYTGYSQGATMGSLMIVNHGANFPYLLLVEGGSGEWTLGRAKRFLASGGKSVGFVCGGSGCARRAEKSAKALERAGMRARVEHVEGGGHTYVGPVGERARELLDGWLLD